MAKKKSEPKASPLEQALDFLSIAFKAGEEQSTYCKMEFGQAVAFNMIIGVGIPIQEDLSACPNMSLLREALNRCGMNYAITQLANAKLLVRSGEFHAYIPCFPPDGLSWCLPDAAMGILDDRFMDALGKVAHLAVTKADSVIECSLLLNPGSVIATNRSVIMEAWHGNDFPPGLIIPKVAYAALKKTKKRIVRFGFSAESVTFYFEDDSWLLSRLFQAKWPPIATHLNIEASPHDIPADFFAAVKKVNPFSTSGRLWVEGNLVSSHPFDVKEEGSGLALSFAGAQHQPRIYGSEDLLKVSKHALKWDENARKDGTLFYGDGLRGLIYHGHFSDSAGTAPTDDEDIPF